MQLFETSMAVRDLLLQIRQGQPGAMDGLFTHCLERLKILSHTTFSVPPGFAPFRGKRRSVFSAHSFACIGQ